MHLFNRIVFALRFRHEVHKALSASRLTGLKFMVIVLRGRPHAVARRDIKRLLLQHRFRRGVSLRDIEARALFTTH